MLRYPQVYERTDPAPRRQCDVRQGQTGSDWVHQSENAGCFALLDARRRKLVRALWPCVTACMSFPAGCNAGSRSGSGAGHEGGASSQGWSASSQRLLHTSERSHMQQSRPTTARCYTLFCSCRRVCVYYCSTYYVASGNKTHTVRACFCSCFCCGTNPTMVEAGRPWNKLRMHRSAACVCRAAQVRTVPMLRELAALDSGAAVLLQSCSAAVMQQAGLGPAVRARSRSAN
jgi:hypothetical protein